MKEERRRFVMERDFSLWIFESNGESVETLGMGVSDEVNS